MLCNRNKMSPDNSKNITGIHEAPNCTLLKNAQTSGEGWTYSRTGASVLDKKHLPKLDIFLSHIPQSQSDEQDTTLVCLGGWNSF